MDRRRYRLGRRQPSVDRTYASIVAAARALLAARPLDEVSVGEIARRAGVSRITVYNRFGSRKSLLEAVARPALASPSDEPQLEPGAALQRRLAEACARWSTDTALHRNLPAAPQPGETEHDRARAERLAAADRLRPGCSIKEAEDVIAAVSSLDRKSTRL